MPDRVADQVVERLSEPLGVPDDDGITVLLGLHNDRVPPEGGRLGGITRDSAEIDPGEPKRGGRNVREEAVETHAGRTRKLDESASCRLVGVRVGVRDGNESCYRAPQLVHKHVETSLCHADRPAICCSAQRAALARIGSSLVR